MGNQKDWIEMIIVEWDLILNKARLGFKKILKSKIGKSYFENNYFKWK